MNPPPDWDSLAEAEQNSYVCVECGARSPGATCALCGFGEPKVTAVVRLRDRRKCPDCGATAAGADWLPHYNSCPRLRVAAERKAAMNRHPAKIRGPKRILGQRYYDPIEERWTSHGEVPL
jgi:NMD protein affecting ribosome stability and mRNA decay